MDYLTLGRTGVKVSRICLGAAAFGAWGNTDHDAAVSIIHRALEAGVNFVDTADLYSAGESEEIVGKALSGGRRDEVILTTKFSAAMGPGLNQRGNSRRWVIRAVEDSLRRLNTDWIDLYELHRPDPGCDLDETLAVLSDLVHAGKIRYIGTSNFQAHAIVEAQWVAERRARERFICEEPPYSLMTRAVERDVLPVCQQYGIAVTPWSPLAGGWLSGKYLTNQRDGSRRSAILPERFDMSIPVNQHKAEVVEAYAKVAADAGVSLIDMAIAFVLQHPAVTSVIVGPRTAEQLDAYLAAGSVRLDDDVLDRIDEIVAPGTTLTPSEAAWHPPALVDKRLRRGAAEEPIAASGGMLGAAER